MEEKVLFTTKRCYKNIYIVSAIALFFIGIIIIALVFNFVFFGNLYYLLLMIYGYICGYPIWYSKQMKNSYIELYEDYVIGISVSEKCFSMNNTCKFRLNYNEIIHVEIHYAMVKIYFNCGSYFVQAKGCEEKVENLIREQQSKNEKTV